VIYRENGMAQARALIFVDGKIGESRTLTDEENFSGIPLRRAPSLAAVRHALAIAAYDRLRVLATELRRVRDEGGQVALRFAGHTFSAERFARLTREV
jgi:hypothetical protein